MADKVTRAHDQFHAQVVSCHGRHHFVRDESGKLYEARRRGKKGDVVVGDEVLCSAVYDNTAAIDAINERSSLIFRQDEWRTKTLASNIDSLVIVYASHPRFNPWFVWKALLSAAWCHSFQWYPFGNYGTTKCLLYNRYLWTYYNRARQKLQFPKAAFKI